jgi:hypothetical protein
METQLHGSRSTTVAHSTEAGGNQSVEDLSSHAFISFVGPLQLDCIFSNRLGFPGANVPDFAVRIIVPTLTWNGVSDRFA